MAESKASGGAIRSGEKTVTTAGTAVSLTGNKDHVRSVLIIAKKSNTGQIYVGGDDVDSNTNDGLDSGQSLTFVSGAGSGVGIGYVLDAIFIDADVNGEGVDYYATI